MAAKRRPQARRARLPRAKKTKSTNTSVARSARTGKSRPIPVSRLSQRSYAARDRSLHALADMRRGVPPARAFRENGVARRTAKKYLGAALVQDRLRGRIRPTKSDRLVRYLLIPGLYGPIEKKVRRSKEATEWAQYKAAVNRFLAGDRHALAPWHGKKIAGIELITSPLTLKSLAEKDLLPYSLYRSFSGGAV